MMPMTKQRLDIPLKLKSVSDSGEFEGYGSVFGVKDSYDDVVVPGWIGPYISRHFLSLNPLLVRRRRYSRGERYPSALCGCHSL